MAKTFRKLVVKPGVYHPSRSDGQPRPEYVPQSRIHGWVNKFKEMKANGIRVPIPWGHQKAANPVESDRIDSDKFYSSRYNASFVDDLEMDAEGALYAVGQVPPGMEVDETGDLVDPVNHTRIGEVSLSACSWRDGSGKNWEDSIRHIALVTHPVAHGTPGFNPVEMAAEADEGETWFSLTSFQGTELAMHDQIESTKPEADEKPNAENDHLIDFKPKSEPSGQPDLVTDLIQRLERAGIHLPEDTTPDNFLQHLKVALHAVERREGGTMTPGDDDMAEKVASNTPPPGPVNVENAPGMFMSLETRYKDDPVVLSLLTGQKSRLETDRRGRIESFRKRGLKPTVADRFLEEVGSVSFSLDPSTGLLQDTELDRQLDLLDEVLPDATQSWANGAEFALPETEVQISPERANGSNRKRQEEAGDELAELAGAPIRRK